MAGLSTYLIATGYLKTGNSLLENSILLREVVDSLVQLGDVALDTKIIHERITAARTEKAQIQNVCGFI